MANKKISELTPLNATPDANDILPLNDTSAGSTFSVKVSELQAATQSLANNLTDISLVSISNGTMLAANGSNYVSLGEIDATGLSNIRADLGLGTAATTASSDYATAAQGATADSATQPGDLGTAAALDVGTSANKIVQLDGAAKLPSVDGSQLTNLPSSAVEGTAVLSTGETGGTKFLREDGDGTCSFQVLPLSVDIVTKTASFTLSTSENGKVINCNLGSRIDITIPTGLPAGFNCRVVQKGAGRVRFLTDGTTTLNSYYSSGSEPNAVVGRYGVVDLVNTATDAYHLSGDYEYLFVYTNNWSNAFDGGSTQHFRTAALSRPIGSWSNTTQYTLSAWIKPNATGGDGGVIGFFPFATAASGNRGDYVGSYYATSGTTYAWYHSATVGSEIFSGYTFTAGQWDHLVQIWDGSNLKGYVNGILKVSVSRSDNGLGTGGTVAIHGSSTGRWNDRAPINIDEVSVWDSALTDGGVSVGSSATGQVATLYNSGTPSDLTSLSPIGWWLMGDSQTGQTNGGTTPTTITDVGIGSHTKADGELYGSATYSNQTP